MKNIIIFLTVLAIVAVLVQATSIRKPPPPVWPSQWNATWTFLQHSNGSILNWGYWYYDSQNGLLRQDNMMFVNGTLISGIFKNGNFYWYIPSASICCLCITNLAITGPNWISNQPTLQYVGTQPYQWNEIESDLWNFTLEGNNLQLYYQSVSTNNPVALSGVAESDDTDQVWQDVVVAPQAANYFYTPTNCNGACPTNPPYSFSCPSVSNNVLKQYTIFNAHQTFIRNV